MIAVNYLVSATYIAFVTGVRQTTVVSIVVVVQMLNVPLNTL